MSSTVTLCSIQEIRLILYLVNKYTDLYAKHPDQIVYKAKAEKYAKIISKTIILSGMDAASFGQNAYFYDAAEGLLTATILLVAEFCVPEERHIVSVFKVIQELLAPSKKKGKNQFQQLMELLPNEHKAKWFAGAALNTAEQSMASVMSTALSRLNAFLDTELEQLLCFDTEIDAETFCNQKSAIFIIMPEENPNTFFMISLIIQQLYREILAVADENGGKLKHRCVFFCDEFGTLPKIESAEMMFSASRSRRLQIVPIIQSFAQLEKNYGKEGAEIIVDNTQDTIFGGFAPNSSSAETLSKALGSRTVMSGSVSRSKNDPSQSLQMIERPYQRLYNVGVKQTEAPGLYKYYSTQRPVDIGTFPKPPRNAPDEIVNYDQRVPVENGSFLAWGHLTYTRPLTKRQASDYELRPAPDNPDRPRSIREQMKTAAKQAGADRGQSAPKKNAPDRGER